MVSELHDGLIRGQQNIYEINPHFGTAADLKALSVALHNRGMVCRL